ncbi:hypothetical protein EJB05_30067 [Eragrostis curvula]|uniref:HAT C-terminal dimerisation domain-containing protein n=1 Tax=Eragrostis curvula TaxID=38414 RepID=A0A5J9UV31_9POAL|nr:hypothetical protein EJB05_30067 [Eragrostis curvula]
MATPETAGEEVNILKRKSDDIHTKRRNRLTTERLNSLVFIQFNSKLMSKREQIKSKKITDVLTSNETTEAQGFLFEGGDDCAMVVYRDEEDEEMDSASIPWSAIGEAVNDQFQMRQTARMRDMYVEEEFESEQEDFEEDQDVMED